MVVAGLAVDVDFYLCYAVFLYLQHGEFTWSTSDFFFLLKEVALDVEKQAGNALGFVAVFCEMSLF